MFFKIHIIIAFCLLIAINCSNSFGQEQQEKPAFFSLATIEDHLELSTGIALPKLKDETISPLLHKGSGIQGNINYFVLSPRFCASAGINLNYATLGNNYETVNENPMYSLFLDINLAAGFNVKNFKKTKLYLGPKLNYLSNQWAKENYSNSYFQYNTSIAIGPYFYTERSIYFRGDVREVNGSSYKYPPNMKVSLAVSVPLVGAFVKPMYHGFSDITNPNADYVSSDSTLHRTLIGLNMLILESKLNVDYHLKNGNSLRLSYWWKFQEFKADDYKYQYALQGITLAFLFRFDKNVPKIEPLKK